MHEAKTKLSQLVKRVEEGEDIVITRNGTPVAHLVPAPKTNRLADVRGSMKGEFWMADDFDELPDDMAEAFGMR